MKKIFNFQITYQSMRKILIFEFQRLQKMFFFSLLLKFIEKIQHEVQKRIISILKQKINRYYSSYIFRFIAQNDKINKRENDLMCLNVYLKV